MPKKKVTESAVVPVPAAASAEPKSLRKSKTVAAVPEKTVVEKAVIGKTVVAKTVKPAVARKKTASKVIAAASADVTAPLATATAVPPVIDAREVQERAYLSWVARGCPMGSPHEDWFRAERELLARLAGAAH